MISLRFGAVLLLPALVGCFLDETPNRDGTTSSSSTGARSGSGASDTPFKPREPGTSSTASQAADASRGAARDAGEPADAAAPAATVDMRDAATQPPVKTQQPDAGTPRDAGVRAPQGPVQGQGPTAGMDAQIAMDAGAPTGPGPGAAQDAAIPPADAQPPTAAGAGGATPGQSAPTPIMPIHRYDFAGSGRIAVDSVGGKDATLRGEAYLDMRGNVQLGQSAEDSVELPNRILAGLNGFTLLGWMELRADDCWRRLFDFIYYREGGGDNQGQGQGRGRGNSAQVSALYLTPNACPDAVPRLGYVTERSQVEVDGESEVPERRQVLLGAAYDSQTKALQLVVDGVVVDEEEVSIVLRELTGSRGSIGSPTNTEERRLSSNITEFRIYDHALDGPTLAEIARRGPDQL